MDEQKTAEEHYPHQEAWAVNYGRKRYQIYLKKNEPAVLPDKEEFEQAARAALWVALLNLHSKGPEQTLRSFLTGYITNEIRGLVMERLRYGTAHKDTEEYDEARHAAQRAVRSKQRNAGAVRNADPGSDAEGSDPYSHYRETGGVGELGFTDNFFRIFGYERAENN